MLHILENPELEVEYPDIQLWRQARDPIIAHDAFTSFMWILFCLPGPMLSCKESYLSLVHVFYAVSVTQVCCLCQDYALFVLIGTCLCCSMTFNTLLTGHTYMFQHTGKH